MNGADRSSSDEQLLNEQCALAEDQAPASSRFEPEKTELWLDADNRNTPLWIRTFYASLPVSAVTVLYGAVHDLHPIQVADELRPDTTANAIWQILQASGFKCMLAFDMLNGLSIARTTDDVKENQVTKKLEETVPSGALGNLMRSPKDRFGSRLLPNTQDVDWSGLELVAKAVATSDSIPMSLLVDYASQETDNNRVSDDVLHELMLECLQIANEHVLLDNKLLRLPKGIKPGTQRHPIIWLVDKLDDLPAWLTHGDGIRQIPISHPSYDMRYRMAQLLLQGHVGEDERDGVARRFADATEGLSSRGMFETVQLAGETGSLASEIENAVRMYRQGLSENPWQSNRLREQLANGEEVLKQRVYGQDEAVSRVLDILKRSALGLTGAHQKKASSAPRGVLYFAGPTGVGKTEMAKAITELVFSDERALIRFDMSEFQDDHAKIRLIGAPPSYVGFGAGGELTNAVMQRPHSIILFDEMDKAGRQVYDLFLQILSDGRLTDGSGRTVDFADTLIIFTSNQGVAAAGNLLDLDMSDPVQASRYERTIMEAVKTHFTERLNRPELLGRLGDNIVVFNPIQGDEAVNLAVKFIEAVLSNIRIRVGNEVTISEEAFEELVARVTTPDVLRNGGRGITTELETRLTNPLGRMLFNYPAGASLVVTALTEDELGRPDVAIEEQ
ncbi:MAG: AAA family ATPase [Collinsella sp.]|nr:AAA family ATPase [Collinsella sp.]